MADAQKDQADDNGLSFYDDPTLSDIQIKFSGRTFHGHKVLLSKKSKYFHKAFTGNFIEASSKTIDLHDEDDPECIIAMLKYIYDVPSILPKFSKRDSLGWGIEDTPFQFFHKLFVTADKYDVPELRELAVVGFRRGFIAEQMHHYVDQEFCDTIKSILDHVGDCKLQDETLSLCVNRLSNLMLSTRFTEMLSSTNGLATKLLAIVAARDSREF